ncbi:MAG: hypothetical protein RLZZ299_201 [Pseudomonadota bacterium]
MDLPASFGRYQLLERLAAGGMAEVFLARSFGAEGFERRVVIKRILPELASNPRFVANFVNEAKLCAVLNHPNVVSVHDLGKVGEEPYIAMEYIHGRDLAQVMRVLRRDGAVVPPDVAASIAASAARGLAHAHGRTTPEGRPLAIVHRDVSPHNILVSFDGSVKLVDFGIARLEGGDGAAAPGGGKFAYMSPEQASGGALDGRSDVFSLGVVLYELLSGRRLFAEGDADEKRRAVIACALPPMREALPDVPGPLCDLLDGMLARDRDSRTPSADAVEELLRAWLFEVGWRGELEARARWLRGVFPDVEEPAAGVELERLVQDLHALQARSAAGDDTAMTTHATATASGVSDPGDSEPSASDGAASISAPAREVVARGEQRSVVVLVAEVNGLTDTSQRAEVEDLGRAHYRLLRTLRGVVDRMGGRAERFDDDTLLVVFGFPRAQGDELDRALACARELHRQAARLRGRGIAVEFGIGIHVGDVIVTHPGRRSRYAARGDTLKLAVRLAYAAEPGNTLVSDRVAALSGDRFPFDRGPELRRKGARGVRASFVLASGRGAGARGPAGRWFRRGEELEVLGEAVARLRDGTGAALAVVGAAGTGKSRLLRELRELATRRGVAVHLGRAAPWGTDRPMAPFRDLLCDVLGATADMAPAALRARLGRLAELGLEAADVAAVAALFSLDSSVAPEPGRDVLQALAGRLVRGLATRGPVVLLLEDLHYLDAAEQALVVAMCRAAAGQRVLLLGAWRGDVPEDLRQAFRVVRLGALEAGQVDDMAAELLGAEAIGPDLRRLVQRTAEGNPLYLEEVVKALRQAGRIYYEGTTARLRDPHVDPGLPATLQGLVAARIDRLDPAARGALQVAAILGRSFSATLLGAAVGAEDPSALVGELVRSGLIVPEGRSPDTGYAFASVLVWEGATRGILGIQRRAYHRMVATAIERTHADGMEVVAETFALHAHAAGRVRDAAAAMLRAGDVQRRMQLSERALACYDRGLGWLRAAPRDQQDVRLEATLRVAAGEVACLLGLPRAESLLQGALEDSEDGPVEVEARALLALGRLYVDDGRRALARAHLDAAATLWRRLDGREGLVRCMEALGALALDSGDAEAARAAYEQGRAVAGTDEALAARMLLGLGTHAIHRMDHARAEALLREALPHAERADDRILLGRIVNNLGIVALETGRHEAALNEFRRALEARAGLGYRHGEIINHHNIGDALLRLGDHARAWASFEQSREMARACDWERGVVMNDVYLTWLRALRGEDVAAELDAAVRRAATLGDAESESAGRAFLAQLAANA